MKHDFKPAWWCRGSHAQTISGTLFRSSPSLHFTRERLELPDGDFLDLDFFKNDSKSAAPDTPHILILHGLEGSSQSPYVRSLIGEIDRRGWKAVVMNMRMCSGEPNRLKQTYHSGKTEDLDFVADYLRRKRECQTLYLAGFSIGGNIVLKWLGEQGHAGAAKICAAAVVSVPFDLVKTVRRMDEGVNRQVYTRALLSSLKSKVRAKAKKIPGTVCYATAKKCSTFQEFDREITAPLNGFAHELDYWSKTSCISFLKGIHVKTLIVHAEDDPLFPGSLLPYEHLNASEYLETLIVPYGGHLGFLSGRWPWKQERWLENRILDYFESSRWWIRFQPVMETIFSERTL